MDNQRNNQNQQRALDHTIAKGCANLLDEIDKRLLVVLRDGRTLIGILRSVDQFANLVLQQSVERIHVGDKYGDIPRGIFLVRGDSVVLIGEIDQQKERYAPLKRVEMEVILEAQRIEQEIKAERDARRAQAFKERGLLYQTEAGITEDN
ncbi:unnamed protein product [Allacma fusca]|uniref:U6 snRNA-associated Sm-like protein LSm1 n=1 Tax=Allacma fusca TaxID=39272 RepID=A0A8J2KIK0_9HEXA|nr:unnamed protein product [Allacma fusca]